MRSGARRFKVLVLVAAFASACARTTQTQPSDWEVEDRIEFMDGQTWVVGSRLVSVASGASIGGTPEVGAVVQLSGQRTTAGELRADRVQVVKSVVQPTATSVPARPKPAVTPSPAVPAPAAPNQRAPARGDNNDGDHEGGS
jgi:hypothetical protein